MLVVYSDLHRTHAPETYIRNGSVAPFKDTPARAQALLEEARSAGLEIIAPRRFGDGPITEIHSAAYLQFLRSAHQRWQELVAGGNGSPNVLADRYAVRDYQLRLPSSIQGQVGYYLSGSAVPIVAATFAAAEAAAYTALEGAQALIDGRRAAYALCRPPGHHAYLDLAGGYCYLNNAAIAAHQLAKRFGRVALIDVDVHHGNGTQGIFYRRSDVHFVSIHADPNHAYPFYSGYADERGLDAGERHTLNLPLPVGTRDDTYREALATAVASIRAYSPAVLVVSLGFDAHEADPQNLFKLSTRAFQVMGAELAALDVPTLLVQEGGYAVGGLAKNLTTFLSGFGLERSAST